MGKQRIRKRRRRRFHKPDKTISILACSTIILLFVWGGLYWKESSEKKQLVNASAQDETQQNSRGEVGSPIIDDENWYAEIDDPVQTIEEVGDLGGENTIDTVVNGEASHTLDASDPQVGKTNKSNAINPLNPDASSSPMKPETNSSSKTNKSGPAKSESFDPVEPNEQQQNSSGSLVTGSPSMNQTAPVVSKVEKYEEEFTKVQGKCTKDMKVVLSGAESNIQQLDKQDPRVVLAWRDNLDTELAAAKSTCDGTFQELIQAAENDEVSANVIEKWKQTYDDLKVKLQEESEAKLKELIGG